MIGNVERLRPELKAVSFPKFDGSRKSHIDSDGSRGKNGVITQISVSAERRLSERRRIQVASEAFLRIIGTRKNLVGPLISGLARQRLIQPAGNVHIRTGDQSD